MRTRQPCCVPQLVWFSNMPLKRRVSIALRIGLGFLVTTALIGGLAPPLSPIAAIFSKVFEVGGLVVTYPVVIALDIFLYALIAFVAITLWDSKKRSVS